MELLSHLFFQYLEINLANEVNVYRLATGDYYTSRTITLMGYTFDDDNSCWIKKRTTSGAPSSQSEEGGGTNIPSGSEAPPPIPNLMAPPTLADVMDALNEWMPASIKSTPPSMQ